jgi:hypothetical protein
MLNGVDHDDVRMQTTQEFSFAVVRNHASSNGSEPHSETGSAEDKSYVLPPVKVPRWRARFQKIC